jgi:hypothetical protein
MTLDRKRPLATKDRPEKQLVPVSSSFVRRTAEQHRPQQPHRPSRDKPGAEPHRELEEATRQLITVDATPEVREQPGDEPLLAFK